MGSSLQPFSSVNHEFNFEIYNRQNSYQSSGAIGNSYPIVGNYTPLFEQNSETLGVQFDNASIPLQNYEFNPQ